MKKALRISSFFWLNLLLAVTASAQLGSRDIPIPVTSNQIVGTIKPRRIGDDRLTRVFYSLDADKGDLFINVEAENLNGDFDLFIAINLKPLAKITIYAADTKVETGRVVFLRKPETLLLRIEGRTPNDNPAKFKIKFAGSFIAKESNQNLSEELLANLRQDKTEEIANEKRPSKEEKKINESAPDKNENIKSEKGITSIEETPKETKEVQKGKVVEEIIEKKPISEEIDKKIEEKQATEKVREETDKEKTENVKEKADQDKISKNIERKQVFEEDQKNIEEKQLTENAQGKEDKTKIVKNVEKEEGMIIDDKEKKTEEKQNVKEKAEIKTNNEKTENSGTKRSEMKKETSKEVPSEQVPKTKEEKTEEARKTTVFANMNLIVIFKDGTKLEKPMQEVSSFKIDEESLVIVTKDGKIEKRKAVDVLQVIIK